MNKYTKTLTSLAILTTFIVITGCATSGQDLVRDKIVAIEKVSSAHGVVTEVCVFREGDAIAISGKVKHRAVGRYRIPGHIDVEVLNPLGASLKKASVEFYRHGFKVRYQEFYVKLGIIPPSGSTIRVIHHNAGPHGPPSL